MDRLAKWKGKTALVTGASSGIGLDMTCLLAAAGCNLILVARREELLTKLANDLAEKHGIQIHVLAADLADYDAAERLVERIETLEKSVDLLVNNAGVGIGGDFIDCDWPRIQAMLQLNVMTLTVLTHLLLPSMIRNSSGDVLLISSGVAYSPMPGFAAYGASKAFVTSFGQALGCELQGTGVNVTVVHPGATESEFWSTAGYRLSSAVSLAMMPSQRVAEIALNAMATRRRTIITGFMNALGIWFLKWIPLSVRLWGARRGMKMIGDLKEKDE